MRALIMASLLGRQLVIVAAALMCTAAHGQTATPESDPAVQRFVAEYVKAWNANDVEALGRMWAADGELIDAQGVAVDRKALLANRQAKPEGARPALSIAVDKVKLLPPNVALIDGKSKLAAPNGTAIHQTRFSGVLVKQDGAWRIRLIRQLSTQQSGQTMPGEPLKELAWIVGEWAGLGQGMHMHTSSQWDLGNRYIVARSEYEPEHGDAYEAEVRIGWDPETNSIKSWYFDSRGAMSTTTWQKNEDHWLGTITGLQNDGGSFTGTMAITPIDNDSYLRTLSNIKVDGKEMPDQELRMFRVPEQSAE